MIQRPNYDRATNEAYKILSDRPSLNLSTNVFSIIEDDLKDSCRLYTYGQASFLYGIRRELLTEESEYGFSIVSNNGNRIVLYNEEIPIGAIRFTLAHEIGHAVLGHTIEGDPTVEKEANCFARNLLCPIPIIVGLDVKTVSDYVSVFDITPRMATVAIKKRNTDHYYIKDSLFKTISFMLEAGMMGFETVDEYFRQMVS